MENFGKSQTDEQEGDGKLAATRKVTPPREPELSLGFAVWTQTIIRSILEIIKQLPTAIINMTKKALRRVQEGGGFRPVQDIT
jgi:hypothetical protein